MGINFLKQTNNAKQHRIKNTKSMKKAIQKPKTKAE